MTRSIPTSKTGLEISLDMIRRSVEMIGEGKLIECIEMLNGCEKYSDLACYGTLLYNKACCYSLLNNEEETFNTLEAAIESGYSDWRHMTVDPDLENFNTHVRFIGLLNRMKNTPYKQKNTKGIELFVRSNDVPCSGI